MDNALSPERTASIIRKLCPKVPRLAVVLGSGFAGVAENVERSAEIAYTELPGFPPPGTAGALTNDTHPAPSTCLYALETHGFIC